MSQQNNFATIVAPEPEIDGDKKPAKPTNEYREYGWMWRSAKTKRK